MPSPTPSARRTAALLGTAAGLRSLTPVSALALHGRLPGGPLTRRLPLLGAGELVGDKLPFTPARTAPGPLVGRIATGAYCGSRAAGPQGAAIGALAAVVWANGGQHTRQWLGRRTGRPDLQLAVVEDAVALLIAGLAARRLA